MKRLFCRIFGHRWRAIAVNPRKNANLYHLCARAGWHEVCDRCGEEWNDLSGSPWFGDEIVVLSRATLPVARTVKP